MKTYYIKLRKKKERAFWFLSSDGRMNRLRVHAVTFSDLSNAETALGLLLGDNPDYVGKVVSRG